MRFVKFVLLGGISILALNGCTEAKEQLGLTKNVPDEFTVVKHAPLEMPPEYYLRPPRPGAARPQETDTATQAQEALFGAESINTNATASSAEEVLLQQAGADQVDPAIRDMVDQEANQDDGDDTPIGTSLLGLGGSASDGEENLNAQEEIQRLQASKEEEMEKAERMKEAQEVAAREEAAKIAAEKKAAAKKAAAAAAAKKKAAAEAAAKKKAEEEARIKAAEEAEARLKAEAERIAQEAEAKAKEEAKLKELEATVTPAEPDAETIEESVQSTAEDTIESVEGTVVQTVDEALKAMEAAQESVNETVDTIVDDAPPMPSTPLNSASE